MIQAKSRNVMVVYGLIFLAMHMAWVFWGHPAQVERYWIGNLSIVFAALAVFSVMLHTRQDMPSGVRRSAWSTFTLAMGLWCLGDVLSMAWTAFDPGIEDRYSILDVFYLGGSAAMLAGLLRFPLVMRQNTSRLALYMDVLISSAALITLFWVTIIQGIMLETGGEALLSVRFLYPLIDLTTLLAFSVIFLISDVQLIPSSFAWISLGMVAYLFSDLSYAVIAWMGTYEAGSFNDWVWILGYALLGYAVLVESRELQQGGIRPSVMRKISPHLQLFFPLITVICLVGYVVWEFLQKGSYDPLGLWVAALMALGLTARQGLMAGQTEMKQYARVMERIHDELEESIAEKTEHLQNAYRQLEEQNQQLQQLDALKSEFVTLVSHELRAPLTNISGGIELILRNPNPLPRNSRQNLETVQGQIRRLNRFVETILDVSSLDAGRAPLYLAPIDLRSILSAARRQAAALPDGGRVRVQEDAPHMVVIGDEEALANVVFHLLDNALKYAPEGNVWVTGGCEEKCGWVRVEDEGPGISEETLPMIFDRFYRASSKDSQSVYGHGLGLYIVRRLLEAMGGSIQVVNRPEGGASFTCCLPLAEEEDVEVHENGQ